MQVLEIAMHHIHGWIQERMTKSLENQISPTALEREKRLLVLAVGGEEQKPAWPASHMLWHEPCQAPLSF